MMPFPTPTTITTETANMKHSQAILHSITPLLQVCINQADRHGLDEIRISKARAREILHLALAAEKELEEKNKPPQYFSHLDSIFGK